MTFQYFISAIIVTFAFDFFVVVLLDGVMGIFLNVTGSKWLKVVIKNDGLNY
jgi:hypothetical protein